ncbi:uncharacterized protein [Penaeus vannamei]|uniref:uncharacterized protein n=1 Tax=Penaeus vannamei TaxID=6689 RepID=UPI00387F8E9F
MMVPESNAKLHLFYHLYEICMSKSKEVLQQVLEWGTPGRTTSMSFLEYLILVKGISMVKIRKGFNQSQRKKLEKISEPSNYDISLLCQCIKYACGGLAPPGDSRWVDSTDTLERYITSIKTFRNDILHEEFTIDEQNFNLKTEQLRTLLNNTLKEAAVVYNIDEMHAKHILEKLNTDINTIRDEPIAGFCKSSIDFDKLRLIVKIEGKLELKRKYRNMSSIKPMSNLHDKHLQVRVRVDKVFTQMEIKQENSRFPESHKEFVTFEHLLELVEEKQVQNHKNSSALLVEGPAGVGKTTLIRKIISDWASGASAMRNLLDFDFVIMAEGRAREGDSLAGLVQSLLSTTSRKVQKEHLMGCIRENKLLFIFDGLDELNSSSEEVLKDIFKLGETDDIIVLCTTRSNKVPCFKRYVPDCFNIAHVKIIGIAEGNREKFVTKYCRALQTGGERKDISGLLQYLRRKDRHLQEHWRLAFNLVLVCILWFLNPDTVNGLTTTAELYMATHELCYNKLKKRLFDSATSNNLDSKKIQKKLAIFLKRLQEEALICHFMDEIVLSDASVTRLEDTCRVLGLPHSEVLSSFLNQIDSWTGETEKKYIFPHKGLQDFFSALHIRESLLASEQDLDIQRVLSGLKTLLEDIEVPLPIREHILVKNTELLEAANEDISKTPHSIMSVLEETAKEATKYRANEKRAMAIDIAKCQNIIIQLTGLLSAKGKTLKERRCAELVGLLKDTGIRERSQWLDRLPDIKCDAVVSRHIARAMDLTGWIEITEASTHAYSVVLGHAKPSAVVLVVEGQTEGLSNLEDLLLQMEEKDWDVYLILKSSFRNPRECGSTFDSLQRFIQKSRVAVRWFRGHLSGASAAALPSCVERLDLLVRDSDHYGALLPFLSELTTRLPRLQLLWLHVAAEVDATLLQPLPEELPQVVLTLDGVSEATVGWACRVVRALRPRGGYLDLVFPGLLQRPDTFAHLLEGLGRVGVRVENAVFASPCAAHEVKQRFHDLVRRELGCDFIAHSDNYLWTLHRLFRVLRETAPRH